MKTMGLILLISLFIWSLTPAQEIVEIPLCSTEEVKQIRYEIEWALQSLSSFFSSEASNDPIEAVDDITREQRTFWNEVTVLTREPKWNCQEWYTEIQVMGQVLDEMAIAYGIQTAYLLAVLKGDEQKANRLEYQVTKHTRTATRLIKDVQEWLEATE